MTHAVQRNRNVSSYVLAPIACAVAMQVLAVNAFAQGGPQMLVPCQEFYRSMAGARFDDYAKKQGVKVKDAEEFQKMKAHIVSHYEGVKVKHSFTLGSRDYVDCVDVHTQPALRKDGKFVALEKPPAPMIAKERRGDEGRKARQVGPMLSPRKKDAQGNVQYCDTGFIPMRRITLDDLVRYETLDDFFNKYGKAGEKGDPPDSK